MADDPKNESPDGGGDGAGIQPDDTPPPNDPPNTDSKPGGLLDRITALGKTVLGVDNPYATPTVIFASTAGMILLIALVMLLISAFGDSSCEAEACDPQTVDVLSDIILSLVALASAALVVMFAVHKNDTIINVFAIVIAGAVFVPSDDLIKLAAVLLDRFDEYSVAFQANESLVIGNQRASSSARDVYEEIERGLNLRLDRAVRKDQNPDQLAVERNRFLNTLSQEAPLVISNIECAIRSGTYEDSLFRLQSRNTTTLFKDIARNRDIKKLYGNEPRFESDLRFLRQESLISFLYDDYESLEVTDFGCALLEYQFLARSSVGNQSLMQGSIASQFSRCNDYRSTSCRVETCSTSAAVNEFGDAETDGIVTETHAIGSKNICLTLSPDRSEDYRIQISPNLTTNSAVRPLINVYEMPLDTVSDSMTITPVLISGEASRQDGITELELPLQAQKSYTLAVRSLEKRDSRT